MLIASDIVLYRITQNDLDSRTTVFLDVPTNVGDKFPAVVTSFDADSGNPNLRVFMDGHSGGLWIRNAAKGSEPGQWLTREEHIAELAG